MTLLPRSLFGRLTLLLVAVVAIATVSMILLFRQDRAALIARQFSDTKIAQLQALRAALESAPDGDRRETLARIGSEFGARVFPESERPRLQQPGPPHGPMVAELENRLRAELGPGTDLRVLPGRQQFLVRLDVRGTPYWAAFPLPLPQDDAFPRGILWSIAIVALLLAVSYAFARVLARPLRQLNAAVDELARGATPAPLPESGPSEIAAVNRRFNAMLASLREVERDRALLLAGVSHDLRTPLARLRLGVEMGGADDAAGRAGMIADIEEMDRIVGQFLDFARADDGIARESTELDPIVRACVDRYAAKGRDVTFHAGAVRRLPLRPTAISRLVSNLLDNALAYGAPPVEVATAEGGDEATIEVRDRGPGIAPGDAERLKRPFTRSSDARARDDGAAGAGLGLAIVERIARMHGGRLDLVPREGGGMIARVTLAARPA